MSKLLSLGLTVVICCVMMTFAYAGYMAYPMPMKGGYYPTPYYGGGGGGGIAPVGQGGIMQFFFMRKLHVFVNNLVKHHFSSLLSSLHRFYLLSITDYGYLRIIQIYSIPAY